jgi:hypothetical protein
MASQHLVRTLLPDRVAGPPVGPWGSGERWLDEPRRGSMAHMTTSPTIPPPDHRRNGSPDTAAGPTVVAERAARPSRQPDSWI